MPPRKRVPYQHNTTLVTDRRFVVRYRHGGQQQIYNALITARSDNLAAQELKRRFAGEIITILNTAEYEE